MRRLDATCVRVSSLAAAGSLRAALALLLIGLLSATSHAVTTSWNVNTDGSFTTAANWNNGVPDANDTAVFRRGNVPQYNVSFFSPIPFPIGSAIHPTVNRMIVGTNPVNLYFPLLVSTLTVDQFLGLGGDTIIGQTASDVAVLNMNLASLSTLYATLASAAGSSGTLNLNGARTFNVTGTGAVYDLIVGASGTGAINVSTGADVTVADDTVLGQNATGVGNVSVSGAGSTWTSSGDFTVGGAGAGVLNVSTGGALSSANGLLGNLVGSTGTATITGAGTTWSNTGALYVGHSGNGTLNIVSGGDVISATASYIGYNNGSIGVANVSTVGGGNLTRYVVNGEFFVGYSGAGTVNITDGGYVQNTNAYIGQNASGDGSVTVSGANSEWNNFLGALTIGNAGSGTLNITATGVVKNTTGTIGDDNGSMGNVSVNGPGSTWDNSAELNVGNAGEGTLGISAGGQVLTGGYAYLGRQSSATGTATVSGSGSLWQFDGINQRLYVGDAGDGRLEIVDGGKVSGAFGYLGDEIDSMGVVSVSGTDSEWVGGTIYVGLHGTGMIDVSEGGVIRAGVTLANETNSVGAMNITGPGSRVSGQVASVGSFGHGTLTITDGAGALFNLGTHIGSNGDAVGEVTVDGAGSSFNAGEEFVVGVNTGTGTLHVTRGALAASGHTDIGFGATANGMVTVSGNGSIWDLTVFGDLNVAHSGRGDLDVIDGGFVRCRNGVIGRNSGSNGTASVDGAGSRWTLVNMLTVGSAGNGSLSVTNGGVVDATTVVVGAPGEINGDGQLNANVQNAGEIRSDLTIVGNVENVGLVSPGNSVGTLAIEGDYVQAAAGKLRIELESSSSYDRVQIIGDALLGGTLEVATIGNFTPAIGDEFTFLTATDPDMSGDISEAFDSLLFPSITNLVFDVIYNAQSVVLMVLSALPGDYNGNGVVDAADYVVWRKNDGAATLNNRDPNGMGVVGQADYDFWRSRFGETIGSGAAGGATGTTIAGVPEPTSLGLAALSVLGLAARARRWRRR